ncbi:hypothetical protein VNO77_17139 [Canavalia gladiata]|uniref:Uncharacterized protein n=1 Tax=Canavalia gladiata TaxID=3824 RepID=A0AAN9LNA7_CANGL
MGMISGFIQFYPPQLPNEGHLSWPESDFSPSVMNCEKIACQDGLLTYTPNKFYINSTLDSLIQQFNSQPFQSFHLPLWSRFHSNKRVCKNMATFGDYATQFLMAIMVMGLFCVTNIVAQVSEIAPTSQMETGAGFALPVSGVTLCSFLLASLVAFMMQ